MVPNTHVHHTRPTVQITIIYSWYTVAIPFIVCAKLLWLSASLTCANEKRGKRLSSLLVAFSSVHSLTASSMSLAAQEREREREREKKRERERCVCVCVCKYWHVYNGIHVQLQYIWWYTVNPEIFAVEIFSLPHKATKINFAKYFKL